MDAKANRRRKLLRGKERDLLASIKPVSNSKFGAYSLNEEGQIHLIKKGKVRPITTIAKVPISIDSPNKPIKVVKKKIKNRRSDKYRVSKFDPFIPLEKVFILSGMTIGEIEHLYRVYGLIMNIVKVDYPGLTEKDKLNKDQLKRMELQLTKFYSDNIIGRHPGKHNPNCPVIRKVISTPMKG